MFIPWSIFAVNLVLTALQIALVCAVGAVMTIYSRHGGEYAHSVRWIYQGGYLEMLASLSNSRAVSARVRAVLVLVILARLVSNFTDNGVSYFVRPATRLGNFSYIPVNVTQHVSNGVQVVLSGWTLTVREGANVTENILLMLNNTANIPNAKPGRIYTPRLSPYDTGCSELSVNVFVSANNRTVTDFRIPSRGTVIRDRCASMEIAIVGSFETPYDYNNSMVDGRLSQMIPSTPQFLMMPHYGALNPGNIQAFPEMSSSATVMYGDMPCGIIDPTPSYSKWISSAQRTPITTYATKCMPPSGEIVTVSVSSMRTSGRLPDFSNRFGMLDEMALSMNASMHQYSSNSTLYVEGRVNGTSASILSCQPTWTSDGGWFICIYSVFDVIMTKVQTKDPNITQMLGKQYDTGTTTSAIVSIHHIRTGGKWSDISNTTVSMLKNASRSSTELLARLGHNFYMDWDKETSYIMYDTADTQQGLEIPTWVVISVLAIITASALLYASSLLLDEKYSSSLYKNIAIQMAPQMGANAPMLMRAKLDPVRFEETPAVSGEQRELDGMETPLVSALYSTLGKVHEE